MAMVHTLGEMGWEMVCQNITCFLATGGDEVFIAWLKGKQLNT